MEEAFDAFYKATWSNEQQEMSFYYLACIESMRGNYGSALELVEKGLVKNAHNIKAVSYTHLDVYKRQDYRLYQKAEERKRPAGGVHEESLTAAV